MNQLFKKSVAEFLGATGFLTAITASSGELKIVTLALALGVLIIILRPISGAHLNPVVSLYFYLKRDINLGTLLGYILAQLLGALAGSVLGSLISNKTVGGFTGISDNLPLAYLAGEVVSTIGMVWLIATLVNNKQPTWIPYTVVAWVIAAGSFTLTGAQANPSVTFGLMFQGLAPNQGVSLIVAQVFGLLVTLLLLMFFAPAKRKRVVRKKI